MTMQHVAWAPKPSQELINPANLMHYSIIVSRFLGRLLDVANDKGYYNDIQAGTKVRVMEEASHDDCSIALLDPSKE
jgi:hypothetical protein